MDYKNIPIDLSDIPEITDFSKAIKNPYAEKIRKHGYSITIHYSPEDVAQDLQKTITRAEDLLTTDLDEDERSAMERYIHANKKAYENSLKTAAQDDAFLSRTMDTQHDFATINTGGSKNS